MTVVHDREVVEVLTDEAAAALTLQVDYFRVWARRRGLRPIRHERRGRTTVAVYDLEQVYEAAAQREDGAR